MLAGIYAVAYLIALTAFLAAPDGGLKAFGLLGMEIAGLFLASSTICQIVDKLDRPNREA